MTDPTLESQLQSLAESIGADIDFAEIDLVDGVRRAIDTSPVATATRPRILTIAAAVAILVLAVVFTIAPAREAVAGWLGIGRTTITIADPLPDASPPTVPARPSTTHDAIRAAALDQLGTEVFLPDAALVGPVQSWDILESELVVAWNDVWFTARRSDGDFALQKIVTSETVVSSAVTTDGDPALWVSAPHLRATEEGIATVEDALLWIRNGVEYRIVGAGDLDTALAVAATLS